MDKARKWTDKELQQMEKHVSKIYNEAYDDISKKWDEFMKSHKPKLDKAYDDLQAALKSGDSKAISDARAVYNRTAQNITINNQRFKEMRDEVAAKISHVNEVAVDYLNGNLPNIYTVNYNAFGDEKISGYNFSLVNEEAVKELATTDKTLLPTKKLDPKKDIAWNEKQINSQMLQGILQGENIPKMADRLRTVVGMNKTSAIRNARTMTTAAENKGRQDSFKKAESDGVIMTREWVTTRDDRTRAWHADLDHVAVAIDEPWVNEYGEIMFPGDPAADPANVYNCRCSIRARVQGFKWNKENVPKDEFDEFEPTKLIGGSGNSEVTDNIRDYYLPEATRDKLNSIEKLQTYDEFSSYLADNYGIELDTGLERLKGELSGKVIPAVKDECQKIVTAVDAYVETFGDDALSSLKKVYLYDENLDTRAAYFFNRIGEHDPLSGEIHFSQWGDDGRTIFHELAHAFQDSHKGHGEDAITYSERVVKELKAEGLKAYTGAKSDVYAAEQFADAFGFGFSRGSKSGLDFIKGVEQLEYKKRLRKK